MNIDEELEQSGEEVLSLFCSTSSVVVRLIYWVTHGSASISAAHLTNGSRYLTSVRGSERQKQVEMIKGLL